MKPSVFILAAGLGERLQPITDHIPKPLLPILGKPILQSVLEKVSTLQVHKIGINLHHKKDPIEDWIRQSAFDKKVTLFPEDPVLGTGGALKNAEAFLNAGTFLIHNSDIVSNIDLGKLLEFHFSSEELLAESRVFTVNEAMRKVPGVVAREEEGFGLRPNLGIRGLNPTRSSKLLLLEDGIPLAYAPYGDNASYYHPPVTRFERIEVLKGSSQILFGPHTVGGLINYITPSVPADATGQLTASVGNDSFGEVVAQYGDTIGNTGFIAHGTYRESDGASATT